MRRKMPPAYHMLILLVVGAALAQGQQRCFRKTVPRGESAQCDSEARYRTISGRCNNLAQPDWGSAGSTLARFVSNGYADGRDQPRGGRHPSSLPSARWISQKNHPDNDVPDDRFTHMVMQFGQFLDHDITLTPKDEETDCCLNGVQGPDCFTIAIPSPDRFFSWVNQSVTCMNFLRSTPVCRLPAREQFNEISSFVDASNVYGSDPEHAAVLRTYVDGRLQRNSNTDQLPTRQQLNLRPNTRLLRPEKSEDFVAGDDRVNEHPFLATMHVVFLREHNRVAKLLKEYLPPHLQTDEILYQEARRIVSAEMQNIVYGEYLPTVLGVDFMTRYDLIVEEETQYDPNMDASIFNSFATAAFRFGHSMINGMFKLVSQRKFSASSRGRGVDRKDKSDRDVYWLWRLREVFDGQSVRGAKLPLENMLEGLITQQPQTCDAFFSTEITDHLFQKNNLRENFGMDLLALNIQRGRDHGLPDYSSFRKACGLRQLTNWDEKPTEIEESVWKKLESAYESVNDIDLYVGGVSEQSVRGGVVGPTFACLIGEQFNRLKRGDRFFYTHTSRNGGSCSSTLSGHQMAAVFQEEFASALGAVLPSATATAQLAERGLGPVAKREVLQRTLGDILCEVSQLDQVQKWVTLQPNSAYNNYESCLEKRRLNLREIAEELTAELNNGQRHAQAWSGRAREEVRRRLVNGGPTTRNSLLREARPRQVNNPVVIGVAAGEGNRNSRVPQDFVFPPEVNRVTRAQRRAQKPSNLFKRPDLTVKQAQRRSQGIYLNRLTNVGVISRSCIFSLC